MKELKTLIDSNQNDSLSDFNYFNYFYGNSTVNKVKYTKLLFRYFFIAIVYGFNKTFLNKDKKLQTVLKECKNYKKGETKIEEIGFKEDSSNPEEKNVNEDNKEKINENELNNLNEIESDNDIDKEEKLIKLKFQLQILPMIIWIYQI